ncbi:MAG: calcium/sodium antiporter [Planctomycetia bacterium]|nr:calcium/sodium antiporter [Planctomycetia bacterium]
MFLLLVGGGMLLLTGGEVLVRAATQIAAVLRIPPLVVGLTLVAACTGAPELAVSLMGCLKSGGSPELAVGNVVGSNICNIMLILGAAALVRPMSVSSKLIRREIPLMILVSALLWTIVAMTFVSGSERGYYFPRAAGLAFVVLFILYTIWAIWEVRKNENRIMAAGLQERATAYPPKNRFLALFGALALFTLGLIMLLAGSNWFIEGAVLFAQRLGVSQLVIGLTVLAVGTSLPELVVSVVASARGRADVAIGNVVGSNIFNILIVLGISGLSVPGGIAVSEHAFRIDIPIMILVAAFGSYLCVTGRRLTRTEGLALLLGYGFYVWLLVKV